MDLLPVISHELTTGRYSVLLPDAKVRGLAMLLMLPLLEHERVSIH